MTRSCGGVTSIYWALRNGGQGTPFLTIIFALKVNFWVCSGPQIELWVKLLIWF